MYHTGSVMSSAGSATDRRRLRRLVPFAGVDMTMKYADRGPWLSSAGSMTTVIVPGPVEFSRGAGGLSGVAISVHALTVAAGPWPVDVEAATWTWYSTQAVS